MRMLIMLPEKKSNSPACISLGKTLLSSLIPTIVQHLLSFAELSVISDEQALFLDEDVKTLVTLPTAVPEDSERMFL